MNGTLPSDKCPAADGAAPASGASCLWAYSADSRHDSRHEARQAGCMKSALPKMQRAARAFLLRLAGENGIEEAARVLREPAGKLEGLPELYADEGDPADRRAH